MVKKQDWILSEYCYFRWKLENEKDWIKFIFEIIYSKLNSLKIQINQLCISLIFSKLFDLEFKNKTIWNDYSYIFQSFNIFGYKVSCILEEIKNT